MGNDIKSEKTLLWIQGESVDKESVLCLNGKRLDKSDETYQKEFKCLVNTDKYKSKYSKNNLKVFYGREEHVYIIHSNYNETDVAGRNIGFMFGAINTKGLLEAVKSLKNESTKLGYSLTDNDLKALDEIIKIKNNNLITTIIILIIMIILISIFYGHKIK